jgi:hypothetical protein
LFSKLNIRGSKNIKPPKGLLATIYSAISATQNFNLIKFIWMKENPTRQIMINTTMALFGYINSLTKQL